MLIRRATLVDGRRVDIRLDTEILEVAEHLQARPGEREYDAAWGTVLPGLNDHHIHLRAAAAAMQSVRVGPEVIVGKDSLTTVLGKAVPDSQGWIRAVGYHESVAGPLDRSVLDDVSPPERPVRVQHRSGVLWTLNTPALARIGLADHPDGNLRSADGGWSPPPTEPDLGALSALLCRYGVTGVTDATPDLTAGDITELQRRMRQTVRALAPGKKILHDDELDLDGLIRWMRHTHSVGIPVAVHCVTAAQLVVALEGFRAAGRHPLDRIEHGAVIPDEMVSEVAASGLPVVTQPNFVAERGDQYRTDVDAGEHHELWRVATLLAAGVPVALSTDAPFGDPDPWAAMRAAVHRRTRSDAVLGPGECVSATTALGLFLGNRPGHRARVEPGAVADLCITSASPPDLLRELDPAMVSATVIAGTPVFERA